MQNSQEELESIQCNEEKFPIYCFQAKNRLTSDHLILHLINGVEKKLKVVYKLFRCDQTL